MQWLRSILACDKAASMAVNPPCICCPSNKCTDSCLNLERAASPASYQRRCTDNCLKIKKTAARLCKLICSPLAVVLWTPGFQRHFESATGEGCCNQSGSGDSWLEGCSSWCTAAILELPCEVSETRAGGAGAGGGGAAAPCPTGSSGPGGGPPPRRCPAGSTGLCCGGSTIRAAVRVRRRHRRRPPPFPPPHPPTPIFSSLPGATFQPATPGLSATHIEAKAIVPLRCSDAEGNNLVTSILIGTHSAIAFGRLQLLFVPIWTVTCLIFWVDACFGGDDCSACSSLDVGHVVCRPMLEQVQDRLVTALDLPSREFL